MLNYLTRTFGDYMMENIEFIEKISELTNKMNYFIQHHEKILSNLKEEYKNNHNHGNLINKFIPIDQFNDYLKMSLIRYKTNLFHEYIVLKRKYHLSDEQLLNYLISLRKQTVNTTGKGGYKFSKILQKINTSINDLASILQTQYNIQNVKVYNIFENMGKLSIDILLPVFEEIYTQLENIQNMNARNQLTNNYGINLNNQDISL
ncbi:hypothetical protein DEFDS_P219 (plasmid) [Deferribacter desulfuricans SSM1]|uniref:Uncharacterized protein n=1 Tax=Deferribacter desulfuricans (strain DSM 14783 / JCM 11476 / NBRC 101012 / SSM1) TaxID=639282 RepID=D3PF47_DEFDS|nr:hypothetical protein [Deferribacter desulfuricans]BAI81839.1 hypothetical protein DEFDS_P219 [Deferribacter desulfuricans SSM1]